MHKKKKQCFPALLAFFPNAPGIGDLARPEGVWVGHATSKSDRFIAGALPVVIALAKCVRREEAESLLAEICSLDIKASWRRNRPCLS